MGKKDHKGNTEPRWNKISAAILEAGCLILLAAVPVIFNGQSTRIFDWEKAGLLRSIVLIMVPFGLFCAVEPSRLQKATHSKSVWSIPLVRVALLYVGLISAATVTSVLPELSFWGSYSRCEGLYDWFCLLGAFLAIILYARRPEQVERLVTALLLSSFVAALYGILQSAGLDPVKWRNHFYERVGGTFGNPIFLGGFLIMVIPLAVARIVERLKLLRKQGADIVAPPKWLLMIEAASYGILLLIQVAALVLTNSRGPFIGLAAGIGLMVLLSVIRSRRTWIIRLFAVSAAMLLMLFGIWLFSGNRLEALRASAERDLPISSVVTRQNTVQVRVLVWEGAGRLLASSPARWVLGYGPETIFYTISRFQPHGLNTVENRGNSADRCHNNTLDTVLTTGFLGLAAETAFFILTVVMLLSLMGFLEAKKDRFIFSGGAVAGGLLGWFLPLAFLGRAQFSGIGMPIGMLAGISGILLVKAWRTRAPAQLPPWLPQPLLLALLAGVVAHYCEIQFGIATATSRLCYWTFAALAIAVSGFGALSEDLSISQPAVRKSRDDSVSKAGDGFRTEVAIGLLTGLILCLITFDMSLPNVALSSYVLTPLILCVALLSFGLLIAVFPAGVDGISLRNKVRAYLFASLIPWLLFVAVYIPWISYAPAYTEVSADLLLDRVLHLANSIGFVYGIVFLVIVVVAYRIAGLSRTPSQGPTLAIIAALLLLGACIVLAKSTNYDISRAYVIAKQADGYEEIGQLDPAFVLRLETLRLKPEEYQLRGHMGMNLMLRALKISSESSRNRTMEQARQFLAGLWQENQYSFQNAWNLATLYYNWMNLQRNPAMRLEYGREADRYYRASYDLFPSNALLLEEWAEFCISTGQPDRAVQLLGRSLEFDDRHHSTYLIRAKAFMKAGSYQEAAADYRVALAKKPNSAEASKGLAAALEAIAASKQTLP